MLSLRPQTIDRGVRQWCGTLAGSLVTLGACVWRRWSEAGRELKPGKSRKLLRAAAGDVLVLWGPGELEVEIVRVVAADHARIEIARTSREISDGPVRVVKA